MLLGWLEGEAVKDEMRSVDLAVQALGAFRNETIVY